MYTRMNFATRRREHPLALRNHEHTRIFAYGAQALIFLAFSQTLVLG